jgi:hypothetical protein
MMNEKRPLYFCVGTQSSGSTLISWCFLQRGDMDGLLDANNDVLALIPQTLKAPLAWVKTTVSSFRTCEQLAYFEEAGWTVRPLLVCRDVRAVYASLRIKHYGRNGTTAEDPPLRLRLRRFREDWELFRAKGWPILGYERFVSEPEEVLRTACGQLGLPWDGGMLTWPKPHAAISDTRHGNDNFHLHCAGGLKASLKPSTTPLESLALTVSELDWLEKEFAEFNCVNGYPPHIHLGQPRDEADASDMPTFEATRRKKWKMQQAPLKALLSKLGLRRAG